MKPDDGMSRRKFLTAVTALAGAAATGCGGGGGGSPQIVPAQSVDTTNTTAFFNEMLAAQKTGQLSPAAVQVINAAANDFSPQQITALNTFMQTLNDESAGEAFIKQNLDPKNGVFHLPPDVQAAVDIANQKWVGTLPFNGGLPTVVNNRAYPSRRSEERAIIPVIGCTIMGFAYNYATIQFTYACNTQGYYACISAANAVTGTALSAICVGIIAATTICIAGTAWWTFGLSIGGCIAACAAAVAATLAATVAAYYVSLNQCAKYCPSGAAGGGQ